MKQYATYFEIWIDNFYILKGKENTLPALTWRQIQLNGVRMVPNLISAQVPEYSGRAWNTQRQWAPMKDNSSTWSRNSEQLSGKIFLVWDVPKYSLEDVIDEEEMRCLKRSHLLQFTKAARLVGEL